MGTLQDAVIEAFDLLGGDTSEAVAAARGRSYKGWVIEQSTYVAGSGAIAMAVPGAHVPALVLDLAFLMHKMAYCAWGVGEICGCSPAGKDDLQMILALWSGAISEQELFGAAVGIGTASLALTTTSLGANQAIGKAASKNLPKAVAKGLPKAIGKGAGLAAGAGVNLAAKKLPGAAMAAAYTNVAVSQHAAKLSEKFAGKIAAKIGSKATGKAIAGCIPIVGAMAGGGINVWFISGVAASARTYYTRLARL